MFKFLKSKILENLQSNGNMHTNQSLKKVQGRKTTKTKLKNILRQTRKIQNKNSYIKEKRCCRQNFKKTKKIKV